MKLIRVKPVINKKNNQINVSLPRGKLPKKIIESIDAEKSSARKMLLEFKGWE